MRNSIILIPDTNIWRDKAAYTLLTDLAASGDVALGAYYPIAFECMTADSIGVSRAALGRMLEHSNRDTLRAPFFAEARPTRFRHPHARSGGVGALLIPTKITATSLEIRR